MNSLAGFINTWSPAFKSTTNRIELRNIRQGGNDFLAAVPLIGQAFWAGSILSRVGDVAQGPIKYIAKTCGLLLNPVVAVPLTILSCAVKQRIYESSIPALLPEQTKYFERGSEVEHPIKGTVSLSIGDRIGHFVLGDDVTDCMENSIEIERDGQTKRFRYIRLRDDEVFNEECREIVQNGVNIRVRLMWELSEDTTHCVEQTVGGSRHFYKLSNEVAEPVQGTITVREQVEGHWFPMQRHYLIGNEIGAEAPNCIKIKASEQSLEYETGRELLSPEAGSKSFMIEGKLRHFASAKYVPFSTLGFSGVINQIPKLPFKIPTRLNRVSIQVLEWVNKHMSNVIRVAIIASGVAMLFFGHYFMAAGAILAVMYEYLNHDLGVIPRKVSLFIEKWMPTISLVGLLIVGSPLIQITAAIGLALTIPSANLWVHQKMSRAMRSVILTIKDVVLRKVMERTGNVPGRHAQEFIKRFEQLPVLEEYDKPLLENKVLNKRQIETILVASSRAYELNPAHFTKVDSPLIQLTENSNFNELNSLWDAIGARWIEPVVYNRLMKRLCDDERFILFLKDRFPEAKLFYYEDNWRLGREENRRAYADLKRVHQNQIEEWVGILAQDKGCTSQQFIADWVKEQLHCFVGKLSGTLPIEGEHRLLDETLHNTAKIIPFLLRPDASPVDREDTLVKLAIEGGNYCTLAMRRASAEVLEGFVEPLENAAQEGEQIDPQTMFERKVRHDLLQARHQILQRSYNSAMDIFRQKEELRNTGEDIHLYNAVTRAMKRGFYPLAKGDLEEFAMTDLVFRETVLLPVQIFMEKAYEDELPQIMNRVAIDRRNIMGNKTLEYLRHWIQNNGALTQEEKEEFLNGAFSNDVDQIADPDNHEKWARVLLYVLGISRENRNLPEVAAETSQIQAQATELVHV